MVGGVSRLPSHVVGILTGSRKDVVVATSDRGPLDPQSGKGEWGDYLTVRPVFPDRNLFGATGYTMKGPGDGSNQDATPRFVVFGRAGATGASLGAFGGTTTPAGPRAAGPADGTRAPIPDVNPFPLSIAAL